MSYQYVMPGKIPFEQIYDCFQAAFADYLLNVADTPAPREAKYSALLYRDIRPGLRARVIRARADNPVVGPLLETMGGPARDA